MFQKLLASVRIGSAEIDTRVQDEAMYPGDPFEAQVVVRGGDVEEHIEGLELQLLVNVQEEHSDIAHSKLIERWTIAEDLTVSPGEEEVFPFSGELHPETPVTSVEARRNLAKVWLQPGLSIDSTVDGDGTDYLDIAPTRPMEAMLEIADRSGFYLDKISTDRDRVSTPEWRADLALDQVFVFKPQGHDRAKFESVQLHFVPRSEHTHVLLEFDRPHRVETSRSMTIDHEEELDTEALASAFRSHLDDV